MKPLWCMSLGLSLISGMGYGLATRTSAEPTPGASARAEAVTANGTTEGADRELALLPEVSGTVAKVHVRDNDAVAQGAVLVELTNAVQAAQVKVAEAQLGSARVELQDATKRRQRAVQAHGQARSGVAEEELDRLAAQVELFRQRVKEAEGRLDLARAELAKTQLRAPFAGRVLEVFAKPGQRVGPEGTRPLLVLTDLSRRRVRAFIEELDAPRVKPGQHAIITVDGLPGREFRGQVSSVLFRMGRETPQSDAPGEYKDVHYRPLLIDLVDADELPVNLRVQARIVAD
jgi:HlyD family secretion protein